MMATMKSHDGIGLAGNQVGIDKQLIVLGYHQPERDPDDEPDELPEIPFLELCNPRVIKSSKEKDVLTEGCLSLPGLELPVERSSGVTVEAQNLTGKKVTIKAKGVFARILQHEVDHLNGVLFTDRVKSYKNINDYRFAKIVFCGSDDFSQPILQALVDAGLGVMAVVTETAKRAGRGDHTVEPIIKAVAETNNIAVFQPADKDELTSILAQLEPDLLVLASYGKILPESALQIPRYGCLNVHPSLLPHYRGATPIQSALLNGETETGVTIMQMAAAVDAGGVINQAKLLIEPTDTTASLKTKLATLGAAQLLKTIPTYLAGQAKISQQNDAEVSLTKKLTKEMGEIDWSLPATQTDRQIRAFNPWPGTFTWLNGLRLKVLSAELVGEKLSLQHVQLEGKKSADWADFKRGYLKQLTKTDWFGKIN